MSKIFGLGCMLLVFGLSLQAVEAQDGAKKKGKGKGRVDVEARFNKLDTNGDKKLSKEEFLKGTERIADKIQDKEKADKFRARATSAFEKNSTDGSMSLDQFKTYAKEAFKSFNKKKKNKSKTDA